MQENKEEIVNHIISKAEEIAKSLKRGNDVEITKTNHGIVFKQVSKKKI